MANATFQGPIRSLNGMYSFGPGTTVNITGNLTIDPALHAGKILRINSATAVITLPTINATADPGSAGPGADPNTLNNIGTVYNFVVETNTTALDIKTDQTDKFIGSLLVQGTTTMGFTPAASNDHIKSNGTTTGANAGSYISIVATAALKYAVSGLLVGSGTVATPFADS
jgi:hypothetical protein